LIKTFLRLAFDLPYEAIDHEVLMRLLFLVLVLSLTS